MATTTDSMVFSGLAYLDFSDVIEGISITQLVE